MANIPRTLTVIIGTVSLRLSEVTNYSRRQGTLSVIQPIPKLFAFWPVTTREIMFSHSYYLIRCL